MEKPTSFGLPSLPGNEIQGTSDSYKGMILAQVSRITYLLTLGNAKYNGPEEMFSEMSIAKSSLRGMQVLEAMIKPILNPDYNTRTQQLKTDLLHYLRQFQTKSIEYFDCIAQWLEVIIEHLDKLNMIPEEEIDVVYD